MTKSIRAIAALAALLLCGAGDEAVTPPVAQTPAYGVESIYVVRYDRWTAADERGFGEFLTSIGDSG